MKTTTGHFFILFFIIADITILKVLAAPAPDSDYYGRDRQFKRRSANFHHPDIDSNMGFHGNRMGRAGSDGDDLTEMMVPRSGEDPANIQTKPFDYESNRRTIRPAVRSFWGFIRRYFFQPIFKALTDDKFMDRNFPEDDVEVPSPIEIVRLETQEVQTTPAPEKKEIIIVHIDHKPKSNPDSEERPPVVVIESEEEDDGEGNGFKITEINEHLERLQNEIKRA